MKFIINAKNHWWEKPVQIVVLCINEKMAIKMAKEKVPRKYYKTVLAVDTIVWEKEIECCCNNE